MANNISKNKENTSRKETIQLFKKWNETNDDSYRDKIILNNMEIAANIANRIISIDPAIDKDDLLQSSMIGLINAVDAFDYQNKHNFVSYASIIIYRTVTRSCYRDKYINVTESLDAINIEEIEDRNNNFEDDILEYLSIHSIIDPVFDRFGPRGQSIINDYFGFHSDECLTQEKIAKKYNMSKTRVYQTIARYKRVVTNRFRFQKINEYNFIHNYKKKGE